MLEKETKKTLHEANTGKIKTNLSWRDAMFISIFGLMTAFLTVFSRMMVLARWSTFESNAWFSTWHPITPWIAILVSCMMIAAFLAKGIDYWLVYVLPVTGIFYYIIQLAMINSWLHPSVLKTFLGWLAQFDFISGGQVSATILTLIP
jgi:hypothetical protein